jgi:hypothetical protein
MPGVADLAAVGDGTGFDEGQGVVAPEARGFVSVFGNGRLHGQRPRQVSVEVY